METALSSRHRIRFNDFELTLDTRELYRNGVRLKVQGQPVGVLGMLLEHPGELVTREDLRKALWPADTFVDFDHSLNAAVMKLREALGDTADNPAFIETIPKRGYRFIAPLDSEDGAAQAEPAEEIGGIGKGRTQSWLWPGFSATILVLGIIFIGLFLRTSKPSVRVTDYRQITHDGWRKELIGTDGTRLYFNRENDAQPIYSASIANGESAPIPVPLPVSGLIDVSPNGSHLLVGSWIELQLSSVWILREPGGSLHRLPNVQGSTLSIAFTPDGKSLIYTTGEKDMRTISVEGSGDHLIVAARDYAQDSRIDDIALSPDELTIRFTKDKRYWEMSSSGKFPHPLFPGWQPSYIQCCGRWTPDGSLFVFATRDPNIRDTPQSPARQIWIIDDRRRMLHLRPSQPIPIDAGPMRWSTPVPARDGKTIFARGVIQRGELVAFNPASRQLEPYLNGISAEHVSFSSDGRSIAYVTFPEGIMWRANRDGSNPIQLTNPPLYPKNPRWSPDGTQITFFDFDRERRAKMYVVSSHGGEPRLLFPDSTSSQTDPGWSPDGRRIIFAESDSPATLGMATTPDINIRILNLSTVATSVLPDSNGIMSPRWSPDGRYIAGLNHKERDLLLFDTRTQRWRVLRRGHNGFPIWTNDGRYIYYLQLGPAAGYILEPSVERVRPDAGTPERIVDLKGFRCTGALNFWFGLDPENRPLLLRDAGNDDIYALTLQTK